MTFDLSGEHENISTEPADVLYNVFGDNFRPSALVALVGYDRKYQLKMEKDRERQ